MWLYRFLITTEPVQIIQDSLNCPPPHFHSEKKKEEQQAKLLSFDAPIEERYET